MATFDIKNIINRTFGFSPEVEEVKIDGNDSRIVNVKSKGKWYKTDPSDLYGRSIFMPVTINGLFLPYCMVTPSGGNKIVETDLTERDGTVKEYIRSDDLALRIQGVVVNRDGTFPEEMVTELRDLWRMKVALDIDCPLTDLFLLTNETNAQDKVVIYDWTMMPRKGVEMAMGFEMNLKSDQEFELELL